MDILQAISKNKPQGKLTLTQERFTELMKKLDIPNDEIQEFIEMNDSTEYDRIVMMCKKYLRK